MKRIHHKVHEEHKEITQRSFGIKNLCGFPPFAIFVVRPLMI